MSTHSSPRLPRLLVLAACSAITLAFLVPAHAVAGELMPDGYFSYAGQAAEWQQAHYPVAIGSATWSEVDAGGAPGGGGSGSLAVTLSRRSSGRYSASACVPVVAETAYTVSADVLLEELPPGQEGTAALEVGLFMGENCQVFGPLSQMSTEVTLADPGWRHVAADFVAPRLAGWALVSVSVSHDDWPEAATLRAHFDNVSLLGAAPAGLPERLYLGGFDGIEDRKGQFAVSATWRAADGATGTAHPVRLSADSGGLWFFAPTNLEIVVKVLDACTPGLSESFWVFVAGMTDLEVELEVTNLGTGQTTTYSSPGGTPFEPVVDTFFFGCEPTFP